MGHQDRRGALLGEDAAHFPTQFLAQHLVQRSERFVEQHDRRFRSKCPRHGDTLLFAARELVRVTTGEVSELDEIEHFGDSLTSIRLG